MTRAFYDALAVDYAEMFAGEPSDPLGRAVLGSFGRFVGSGPAVDVGCGPGRVTGYLADLGVSVYGVDLSPEMVKIARGERPDLRFEVGSMWDLGLADGSLAGLSAWYSVIHTPAPEVGDLLAEFGRMLRVGGHLVLGFQIGDEPLRLERPLGHDVSLDFNRLRPAWVVGLLEERGFEVVVRVEREALEGETAPQAYLIARRQG
ncbi:class I SAM-dependent methyltransferase [Actinokineospora auranticolor]|uniref:Methyltransferase family protein n=1 Tax=Actinokineospora auranticolor TaxID=155976 RepID=A0A2S6GR18_9PSEU|nr:class I SAM-dependent methyltransferase [Actinokineospora auranticolor]PPK67627.1 methyltransferase family protein [Actinokineospora auranticolor]